LEIQVNVQISQPRGYAAKKRWGNFFSRMCYILAPSTAAMARFSLERSCP